MKGFTGEKLVRILFANAEFNPGWHEGRRIHIEQLTSGLMELGHEIWVRPGSPLPTPYRLSLNRQARLKQLRHLDAIYFRMEGRPVTVPRWLSTRWGRTIIRAKCVWEVNAASDYVAKHANGDSGDTTESLDRKLSRQARLVDLAICNTDGLRDYVQHLGVRRTVVVPLGTDPAVFHGCTKPTETIGRSSDLLNVVWMGNGHVAWHDLSTIGAAANLLYDRPGIRFYLIGDVPGGIDFPSSVVRLGKVDYENVPAYLSAMDVGLAVYSAPEWSRYGVFSSPLKLFDYFASGLLVVASPIEQVTKTIVNGENGFIVPFGAASELAGVLKSVNDDRSILKRMRWRMRTAVESYYNWKRVASDTARAIECI